MLEQEIASIIKFTLEKTGSPTPYYNEVPEGFLLPSVYFPVPEVSSGGDTLATYALNYALVVKFFHIDARPAYERGFSALTAIRAARNLIPLIDESGARTGRGFRLKDPTLKKMDGTPGVAQLELSWDSPRPYDDPDVQKMMVYDLNMYGKSAYEAAVEQVTATAAATET